MAWFMVSVWVVVCMWVFCRMFCKSAVSLRSGSFVGVGGCQLVFL